MAKKWAILLTFLAALSCQAERINHEGRILGPLVSVTNATLFNTPQADGVVSSMQVFPRDHAWNENISSRPLLSNSAAMMAQIVSDLATNRRTLRVFQEMNFVLVPTNQPLVPIVFDTYPSRLGSEPLPFCAEHAHRRLAEPDRRALVVRLAAGHQWLGRGSARHCRPARNRPGLGDMVDRFGGDHRRHKLDRCQWREMEPDFECVASGRMDLGGCGGALDVRWTCALRRVPARNCGACHSAGSETNTQSVRLSGHALCVGDLPDLPQWGSVCV